MSTLLMPHNATFLIMCILYEATTKAQLVTIETEEKFNFYQENCCYPGRNQKYIDI